LLTPIVKGWCTELGQDLASTGVQIHGGMGFVEETGAAQYLRDARITTIYEGTTGIQAQDLVGRKTLRDGGAAARELLSEIRADLDGWQREEVPRLAAMCAELAPALAALEDSVDWLLGTQAEDPRLAAAASVHYLTLWGNVVGGWLLIRAAALCLADLATGADTSFARQKILTAEFFAMQYLPPATGLARAIRVGSRAALVATAEAFG
jgi:hypothetical protein